jgi:hypothetical protein
VRSDECEAGRPQRALSRPQDRPPKHLWDSLVPPPTPRSLRPSASFLVLVAVQMIPSVVLLWPVSAVLRDEPGVIRRSARARCRRCRVRRLVGCVTHRAGRVEHDVPLVLEAEPDG